MVRSLPRKVQVESYAGHKADERPVRFTLNDRRYEVREILDRWYGEESDYFRVKGDDGEEYILRHYRADDEWGLEG